MKPTRLIYGILPACVILLVAIFACNKDISVKWVSPQPEKSVNDVILNVFIENSGSMNGYMVDGSEFKDAVKGYISNLNRYTKQTNLFYINSKITPQGNNIKSFVNSFNTPSFTKSDGSAAYTDISELFKQILAKSNDNCVTIFVSDMILDLPNVNATKYLVDCKIDIQNYFVDYLKKYKNTGVEIFRLNSQFSGMYYYSSGHEKIDAKRPYYMIVIGNKYVLAKLNKSVPLNSIEHGVEYYYAYTNSQEVPFVIGNKFGTSTSSTTCTSKLIENKYSFSISADLSTTLLDDVNLCDVSFYSGIKGNINIESVVPITNKKSKYTHVINISLPEGTKPYGELLTVKNKIVPSWYETINDETGKDIKSNLTKTTGIKYVLEGIGNAYKDYENRASIKFSVGLKK